MSEDRLAAIEQRLAQLEAVLGRAPIAANEERLIGAMLRYAADETGLSLSDLLTRRTARHAHARFAVMYAARETLGYSLPRIASAMSRDHSTVIGGIRRAIQLRDTDPLFRILSDRLVATFRRILSDPDPQKATTA